jgi:hypothetical protein
MGGDPNYPAGAEVRRRVIAAIVDLHSCDSDLLYRDVNERSITHKLAEHLQRGFSDWHVDCEYNRDGDDVKRLELPLRGELTSTEATEARTVFPDIVVHRRGTDHNLVVVEVKKHGGAVDTKDREKVEAFVTSPGYRYLHGMTLKLGLQGPPELKCYSGDTSGWDDLAEELLRALKERRYGG